MYNLQLHTLRSIETSNSFVILLQNILFTSSERVQQIDNHHFTLDNRYYRKLFLFHDCNIYYRNYNYNKL